MKEINTPDSTDTPGPSPRDQDMSIAENFDIIQLVGIGFFCLFMAVIVYLFS